MCSAWPTDAFLPVSAPAGPPFSEFEVVEPTERSEVSRGFTCGPTTLASMPSALHIPTCGAGRRVREGHPSRKALRVSEHGLTTNRIAQQTTQKTMYQVGEI